MSKGAILGGWPNSPKPKHLVSLPQNWVLDPSPYSFWKGRRPQKPAPLCRCVVFLSVIPIRESASPPQGQTRPQTHPGPAADTSNLALKMSAPKNLIHPLRVIIPKKRIIKISRKLKLSQSSEEQIKVPITVPDKCANPRLNAP